MKGKRKLTRTVRELTPEENELRLIARLKNNRLLKIRETMKMNQREFSELIGVDQNVYSQMENLKFYPLTKKGEWNTSAQKIAKALRLPEDYIWPESLKALEKTKIERELSVKQILIEMKKNSLPELPQPEAAAVSVELTDAVDKMLKTLSPREEKILRMRFHR